MIKLDPKNGKLKVLHGDRMSIGKPIYYGFKKNGMIVGYIEEISDPFVACSYGNVDFKTKEKAVK